MCRNTIESYHVNKNRKIFENVEKCDQEITKGKDQKRINGRVMNSTKPLFDSTFIDDHEPTHNQRNQVLDFKSV